MEERDVETQGRPTGVTQAADRSPLREEGGAQRRGRAETYLAGGLRSS